MIGCAGACESSLTPPATHSVPSKASCHALSYHALSSRALSCRARSYHARSCRARSYHALTPCHYAPITGRVSIKYRDPTHGSNARGDFAFKCHRNASAKQVCVQYMVTKGMRSSSSSSNVRVVATKTTTCIDPVSLALQVNAINDISFHPKFGTFATVASKLQIIILPKYKYKYKS